jgi:protein gp37
MAGNFILKPEARRAYAGNGPWLNTEELSAPFKLKKPSVIGVQFMGDLFHMSVSDEQIAAAYGAMMACPQHTFIILTKRAERMFHWYRNTQNIGGYPVGDPHPEALNCAWQLLQLAEPEGDGPIHCKYGPAPDAPWPPRNVIPGVSVEDQRTAEERWRWLSRCPADVRCVSVEPMLGPVDLCNQWGLYELDGGGYSTKVSSRWDRSPDWVICGAETGPRKRPFKNEWALDLRDQCRAAGVPFFFKQDGDGNKTLCGVEYHEWPK